MTIGPFTLSRGRLIPAKGSIETASDPIVASDGSVGGADDLYQTRMWEARLKLPRAEAANLVAYIANGLRFWRETVEVTDSGITRVMRYWSRKVSWEQRGGEIVELTLPFREEVGS